MNCSLEHLSALASLQAPAPVVLDSASTTASAAATKQDPATPITPTSAASATASPATPMSGQVSPKAAVAAASSATGVAVGMLPAPSLPPLLPQPLPSLLRPAESTTATVATPSPMPANRNQDWARHVSVEERRYIREKIKAAYLKKMANNFEDLLDTCCAIEEELIFVSAPSRLDYFKSGVQYEKRVAEKRAQLKGGVATASHIVPVNEPAAEADDLPKPIKRAKTNH